jgi:hypothetical protein
VRPRAITLPILAILVSSCAVKPDTVPTTVPPPVPSTTTTSTTQPPTTSSTTSTTIVEVPDGYALVEIEAEEVRLALPGSWVTVDLTRQGWEELLAEGLEAFPDSAGLVDEEGQAIISQGGLLLAYDFEHQDGDFVTNLNVLAAERGPLDDPDVIIPVLVQQLEQIGVLDAAVEPVEVPLGSAIRASYALPPETGFSHTTIQYYVFAPDWVYIVTFSTKDIVELEIVFETIMSTFDTIEQELP